MAVSGVPPDTVDPGANAAKHGPVTNGSPAPPAGEVSGHGQVSGHGRPSRLRSIRIRIVLPVALAALALIVLGLVQTRDAVEEARAAERVRVLAGLSGAAVALIHHVQLEYAETNALRQRGGQAGAQLLTAARDRTDAARSRYEAAGRAAEAAVPGLAGAVREANRALDALPAARDLAPGGPDGSAEVLDIYDAISEELIAVADAAPIQLDDSRLVETAQAVVLVAELEHLAAEQLDLLRRAFTRQRLLPGELVRLARSAGGEAQRRDELARLTGQARDRFAALVSGPDVERAAELRDAVLGSDGAPSALRADPDLWYVAQSGLLRRLRILEVELSNAVDEQSRSIRSAAQTRTVSTAAATIVVVLGTLAAAVTIAVRTSRRMRRLRDAALLMARADLPDTVARVTAAPDVATVRGAVQESTARIDTVMAAGADEVGELGHAFGTVHRQALRLAADQALLRMEVEKIFVALSRRGRTLALRQLQLIDAFGDAEPDPDRRARLDAIDHIAARIRRNEENLLVLAGGEPARRFVSPVPLVEAIAVSIEEVEDRSRVYVAEVPAVAIAAHAAGDMTHLLAEVLENATTFSPPTTTVLVSARRTVEQVHITVFDEGIGMSPEQVAEVNRRLAQPAALTSSLVGTMGLLVVARLARRHGVTVRLSSTPGGGTAATVTLPEALLAEATATADHLRAGRWRRAPGGSPEADRGNERPYPGSARKPGHGRPADLAAVQSGLSANAHAAAHAAGHGNAGAAAHDAGSAAGHVAGYTAVGLPRRVAGMWPGTPPPGARSELASPADPVIPAQPGARSELASPADPAVPAQPGADRPPATRPPAPGPPDPDVARARLSSLATGIAAAQRRRSGGAGRPQT
jgi:signal transduction histidine kinase